MTKPLLITFLGAPGSGKTYFASRLAPEIGAVTFNGDALRLAIHRTPDKIEQLRNKQPARVYADVFAAMDYATRQSLAAGHSVIYDSQATKRRHRRDTEKLAAEMGAIPILVWIQTDSQVAIRRGQQRTAADDTHPYSAEKMTMLMQRFEDNVDLPADDENVIKINGEAPFSEQLEQFQIGLQRIQRDI